MSSLSNINNNPVLAPYLIESGLCDKHQFTLLDVGSRGGYEGHWRHLDKILNVIGFEADIKECDRLNEIETGKAKHYPFALGSDESKKKFYLTENAASCTLFKPKSVFLNRFVDSKNLSIKETVEISTYQLDTVMKDQGIGNVDFIKLDIEGGELSVLQGGENALSKSVFGVQVEISFSELLEGAPDFLEIKSFLNERGFELYDLGLVRLGRKNFYKNPGPKQYGQVVSGHALFFRDILSDDPNNIKSMENWHFTKYLKLAATMEIFGLPDCASEILSTLQSRKLLSEPEVDKILNQIKLKFRKENNALRVFIREVKSSLRKLIIKMSRK